MNQELDKYKGKKSSRHHYIPKFLINGFSNQQGKLYVYDKEKDIILKKSKSPKSIFFEWDRNTITLPDQSESSILEDFLFLEIDNIGGEVVNYFQKTKIKEIKFTHDNIAQFLYFLVCLFWRIPKTDYAVDKLVKSAEMKLKGIKADMLKNDKSFIKTQRSGIIRHTMNEMISDSEAFKNFVNIHQIQNDILVIGDHPLLYRKLTQEFSSFGKEDFIIAISSNRIFSSTKQDLGVLSEINAVAYNTAVIRQSVRYICCGDLGVLEKSIRTYKMMSESGFTHGFEEAPFRV